MSKNKQIQTKWTEEEVEIIISNYNKITYKEINKLLPTRTVFQIRNKANYMGLCSQNNLRKYSVNKQYFKKLNVQNCYWGGFIAADGNIYNKRLSIGLAHKDKHLLEKLVENMQYTNPVKEYKDRVSVTLNCQEVVNDLRENFNIVERKSNTLLPPTKLIEEKLILSFIKGVIDGDGSVWGKRLVVYGTKPLLDWIKVNFDNIIPKSNYKIAEVRHIKRYLYYYSISGKRFEFICNKFLSLNTYQLDRKWNKTLNNGM